MNILSLFSFFAFVVYIYLGIYTFRLDPRSRVTRTFSLLCASFALWAFAYTFFYSAPDRESCWFWYRISAAGWCFFPGISLHFFLALTEKDRVLKRHWLYPALYLPGAAFLFKSLSGVFLVEDFIHKPLGWCEIAPSSSAWFWMYVLYYSGFIITGSLLTVRWGRASGALRKKKQAKVIVTTAVPVLILTAVSDSLLPAVNIQVIPSVASILILVWVSGIWYAIINYKLMILTPSIAADEIISKMIDLLVLVDPEGNIIKVNRQAKDLLGYGEDELIGRPLATIMGEGPIADDLARIRKDSHRTCSRELTCRTRVGEEIPVNISCSGVKDREGDVIGIVIVGQDIRQMKRLRSEIGERMLAEEALQNAHRELDRRVRERTAELVTVNETLRVEISERKRIGDSLRKLLKEFNTLLDAISDPFLMLLSPDLKIMWANRGAVSVMGREMTDLIGQYCYASWHNRSVPCDSCHVLRSFETGNSERAQRQTGNGKIWDLQAFPIKDEDGKILSVIDVVLDISERLALQAEATRAAHLASIGELAAGVAHEINNPINGIINYAQILLNRSTPASKEYDIAGRIRKESDRIATIVRNLLSFSRDRKGERILCRIPQILADALSLMGTQLRKEGILLLVDLPEDLPEITANPQQLQQVFVNVTNNARYALNQKYPDSHENKIIEISCERMPEEDPSHIQLRFRDHGTGIPSHLLEKVKTPFFTTKPAGRGTGLGLSISHNIISDHNGTLIIHSTEGESTEVAIILPVKEAA